MRFLHQLARTMTASCAATRPTVSIPVSRLVHTAAIARSSSSSAVWSLGRLNHVAIATPDLDSSISLYRDVMGATVSSPEALPEHGVTVVFVELANTKIELLHPLGKDSPIAGFLKKNANGGIHHVCIEVDDIEAAVKDLRAKKIRCLADKTKIGAHGKPVMFLHPKDCAGVLVELEQA